MTSAANKGTRESRAELRAWYLRGLLPKLARAASTGSADAAAVYALDAEMRALLDIAQEWKEAA